jgi:hypothetical protein
MRQALAAALRRAAAALDGRGAADGDRERPGKRAASANSEWAEGVEGG